MWLHSAHIASYSPFAKDGSGEISFVSLASHGAIRDVELQKRAASRSTGKYTRHFIALANSKELAFVSLDFLPVTDALAIYEIFIPSSLRGHGSGAKLLLEIENMAKQQGYSKVRLAARPMEGVSQSQLAAWYKKRGYVPPSDSIVTAVLEKMLP